MGRLIREFRWSAYDGGLTFWWRVLVGFLDSLNLADGICVSGFVRNGLGMNR